MWRVSPSKGRGRYRVNVGGLDTVLEGRGTATSAKLLKRYCKRTLGRRVGKTAAGGDMSYKGHCRVPHSLLKRTLVTSQKLKKDL